MTEAARPAISWDQIPEAMRKEMNISREQFDVIVERQTAREARAPAVGTVAPAFRLRRLDEKGTIAWRSGPGPLGFDIDGFEAALRAQAELG